MRKSDECQPKRNVTRFNMKSYVQDNFIPNYTSKVNESFLFSVFICSLSDIVELEFRNNLTKSREYLKTTVYCLFLCFTCSDPWM